MSTKSVNSETAQTTQQSRYEPPVGDATAAEPQELDLTFVDQIVEEVGSGPHAVIPLLQALQKHYRYLPQEALHRVCEITEISPAAVVGVASSDTVPWADT